MKNIFNKYTGISIVIYFLFLCIGYILVSFLLLPNIFSNDSISFIKPYSFILLDLLFAVIAIFVTKKIHNINIGFTSDGLLSGIFKVGFIAFLLYIVRFFMVVLTNKFKSDENNLIYNVVFCCLISFTVALYEESLFRGLLLNLMTENIRKHTTLIIIIIVNSLMFSLCHISHIFDNGIILTTVNCFSAFCTGFFFSAVYYRTNNIWVPIIFHTINNLVSNIPNIFANSTGEVVTKSVSYSIINLIALLLVTVINSVPFLIIGFYIVRKKKCCLDVT